MNGRVLAGGLSSRFGSDKALFCVEGEPLALRTARILTEAGLHVALVVRASRGLGVPEVIEPEGPRHPLWGIAAALDGDTFFAPCDLPELTVDQVRRLLDANAVATDQPLLGVWPGALKAELWSLATAGAPVRGVAARLPQLDIGPVPNLNRPPGSRSPGEGDAR